MTQMIALLILSFILCCFVKGTISMVENYKLFEIQHEYCKKYGESSLEEYKLCNGDMVTFYKRKINNDR